VKILKREDLRQRLIKNDIAPVYTLFGAETYLRELAAKTIANKALSDCQIREFNEDIISLSSPNTDLQTAISAAEQLPMMSSRRVITITEANVSASGKKDTLKEDYEALLDYYLSNPSESSVVIFVCDELDKRRKISKLLIEKSVAVEFEPLRDVDLIVWAKGKFKEANAEQDDRTVREIVELVGNDVRRLTTEIQKLLVAALPEKVISIELVRSLVSNSRELTNYQLTDRMLVKNRKGSLETLYKILDDGAEPLMLLGLIASNYRRLLLAKELMAESIDRNEIAKITKTPPFKIEEFLGIARRADVSYLTKSLKRISRADLAIKSSLATPKMQIEMLVLELTA
jgi:DNA polymerase III subunit delta